jgi:hypothetical protein
VLLAQSQRTISVELRARESSGRALGYWLIIALICLVAAGKAISTTLDPDLWWHLLVAQQLRADGIGPLLDRISYASIKTPWSPYSWLAELGMQIVWNSGGFRATIGLQAMAVVGTLLLVAQSCVEVAGRDRRLNCALATAIAAYLTLPYVSFRPATFAIFWLALCAWLLLRDRRMNQTSRAVWLVVPIAALLTNIHLSVVMLPMWMACLAAGSWIERDSRSLRRYLLLLAATLAAATATPMLPGAIKTAWRYQFSDVMVDSGVIAEMARIYSGVSGLITTATLIALFSWSLRQRRPVRVGEWIWITLAGLMMLRLGRFAPMFAMIGAPVLAATLPKLSDRAHGRRLVVGALAIVLCLGTVRAIYQFPQNESLDVFLARDEVFCYPTRAATYVEQNLKPRTRRLITDFSWGGYLAWRMDGAYQVLLDGRTQLYTPDFWRQTYLGDEQSRARLIQDMGGDVAILSKQRSIFTKPLESLGWVAVYTDEHAIVMLPPGPTGSPSTAPDSREPDSASSETPEAASARRSGNTPAHPAYAPRN